MKIAKILFREVRIPLKFQIAQANNSGTRYSSSAIVELHTKKSIIGYGEACPRMYVTGENMESMQNDLQKIAPQIIKKEWKSLTDLRDQIQHWEWSGMGSSSICAMELAWLDAWSRSEEKPLCELMDITPKDKIRYSLALPLVTLEKFPPLLRRAQHFIPPAIKLKVNNDHKANQEKIQHIRDIFGAETSISLDVNGGWTLEEAKRFIPDYLDKNIQSFEQPLAPTNIREMALLTKEFSHKAQIMADESLLNIEQAKNLIENKACNHFNLKISKLGGLLNSLEVYELAQQNGISCQLGAHFGETSILTGAGLLLASLGGEMTSFEGALSDYILEADIARPAIRHQLDGTVQARSYLQNPGLVGLVDKEKLEKYTHQIRMISLPKKTGINWNFFQILVMKMRILAQ